MKKLLHKLTGWLVKKTNYTPELPLPIQPIIITPENLKRYHAEHIVPYQEHMFFEDREGAYIKTFRFDIANELLNEIIIKAEEVPEGIKYSCDLLMENI